MNKKPETKTASAVSIPFLIAALKNDARQCEIFLEEIRPLLAVEEKQPSKCAWIWGRVLLSLIYINKLDQVPFIAAKMTKLLSNAPEDCFAAWAWAYLACYTARIDIAQHTQQLNRALLITDKLPIATPAEQSDKMWGYVMALYAAAQSPDGPTNYYGVRAKLSATQSQYDSPMLNVIAALKQIQDSDWSAWGFSFAYNAAISMKDNELAAALESIVLAKISNAVSDEKTLAELYYAQTKKPFVSNKPSSEPSTSNLTLS